MRFEIDRVYDLRVLAALAPTLGLFAPAALRAQLGAMTEQRRAICFTLMAPASRGTSDMKGPALGVATVLVCLHVSPAIAAEGLEAVLKLVARAGRLRGHPIHELAAPVPETAKLGAGFYREAIYLDAEASIAVTTHTPPRLPPEAMQAVAALLREAPIDAVTTIAIAPANLGAVAMLPDRAAGSRPTLH